MARPSVVLLAHLLQPLYVLTGTMADQLVQAQTSTVQLNTRLPSDVPIAGGSAGQPGATGWQHTGVTLRSCEQYWNGYYYELDGRNSPLVVDGCDFSNQVVIRGNVTLKRSRVVSHNDISRGGGDCNGAAIKFASGAGPVLIEDLELTTTYPNAVGGGLRQDRSICMFKGNSQPVVLRRVWTHGTMRGLDVTGQQNILVEDSYLGPNASPPTGFPPGGAGCPGSEREHASAIRAAGGTNNITLRNTVLHIGACSWASGLIATYPENGANRNWEIDGGRWIIESFNGGGYGIAAGTTPSEPSNYNYNVHDLEISTEHYSQGCPSGCAQNWNQLEGYSIWENVTRYNPGQPDHGQPIGP